jgi:hypothetical protein
MGYEALGARLAHEAACCTSVAPSPPLPSRAAWRRPRHPRRPPRRRATSVVYSTPAPGARVDGTACPLVKNLGLRCSWTAYDSGTSRLALSVRRPDHELAEGLHSRRRRRQRYTRWGSNPCSDADTLTGWPDRSRAAITSRASSTFQRVDRAMNGQAATAWAGKPSSPSHAITNDYPLHAFR